MYYLIFKITPPPSHSFKCRVQILESNWTVTLSMFSLNFKITPSLLSHSTLLTSVQIIGVVNWVGVVPFDVWSYGISWPNIKPLGWLKFRQNLLYISRTIFVAPYIENQSHYKVYKALELSIFNSIVCYIVYKEFRHV